MSLTFTDILEKLKKIDEVSLLEILEISSEDIVYRFQDKIEDRVDNLIYEFEDEMEEDLENETEWWETDK